MSRKFEATTTFAFCAVFATLVGFLATYMLSMLNYYYYYHYDYDDDDDDDDYYY